VSLHLSVVSLWVVNYLAIIVAGVLDPEPPLLPLWAGSVLFVVLFFYGFLLYMRAHKAVDQVLAHPKETLKLVTTDAYERIRHPGYLGLMIMGFSFAFLFNSVVALVVEALFAGVWVAVAMNEEKFLLKKFGKKYEAYKKKTGFMIPKWW
jgi:protein-S-isoprenylcysteine O-methyltransferase Ste14